MNIVKVVSGSVNSVSSHIKIAPQEVNNTISKASEALADMMPNFVEKFSKNSNFHKYSEVLQQRILKFKEACWIASKTKNNENLFTQNDTYLNLLINSSDDEKIVRSVIKDFKTFNAYKQTFNSIFNAMKKSVSYNVQDRNSTYSNLAIMRIFNPKSFKALCKSKGMDEIAAGRLHLSYLKDVRPMDKIDDNFFYKLFENIEKTTNKRLADAGLDVEAVNRYIKLNDEKICLNPKELESFLSRLESINNPELANKILNKFEMTPDFMKYNKSYFIKIIEAAKESPQEIEKALKIKQTSPYGIMYTIDILKNSECNKITDDIFNFYLDFEKTHPEHCNAITLEGINKLLTFENSDIRLLKNLFAFAGKKNFELNISDILYKLNNDNIDFLKKSIAIGNLDKRFLFKFCNLDLKNFKNCPEELDKIYENTYLPFIEMFSKCSNIKGEIEFLATRLTRMKLSNPEEFQKLENTRILNLIKENKINPRTLYSYSECAEFTPKILDDIQKLINGENIIKKFESTKDILKKTTAGDVISVKNKLYINNNGRLEPWNMTEEKFNELFPLVDRFSTKQGYDDCYLVTVLNSLYQNPRTRGKYYKMFEQKGNDIIVTIPAYKDFGGGIIFPNGEIQLTQKSARAAKHLQLIEQAYGRTALRKDQTYKVPNYENPLTTTNIDYLHERICGGYEPDVINDFLPEEKLHREVFSQVIQDKNKIENILNNLGQNQRYMINTNHLFQENLGHATSISSYDSKTGTATIIDPEKPAVQRKIQLNDLLENIFDLIVTRFK